MNEVHLIGEKLYNLDGPVKVESLSTLDIKKLAMINQNSTDEYIYDIVAPRVHGIDIGELFVGDFWYIMMHIQNLTFPMFPVIFSGKCPHCKTDMKIEYKVNMDFFDDINEKLTQDTKIKLSSYPEGIRIRLPKVKDSKTITKMMKKLNIDKKDQASIILITELCMLSEDVSIEELWEKVLNKEITAEDIMLVELFLEEFNYGPKNVISVKCDSCSKEVRKTIQLDLRNFFPTDSYKKHLREAILFS